MVWLRIHLRIEEYRVKVTTKIDEQLGRRLKCERPSPTAATGRLKDDAGLGFPVFLWLRIFGHDCWLPISPLERQLATSVTPLEQG
jgi:hypothetical protein